MDEKLLRTLMETDPEMALFLYRENARYDAIDACYDRKPIVEEPIVEEPIKKVSFIKRIPNYIKKI